MIATENLEINSDGQWYLANDGVVLAVVENTNLSASVEYAFSETLQECPAKGHRLAAQDPMISPAGSKLWVKSGQSDEFVLAITKE